MEYRSMGTDLLMSRSISDEALGTVGKQLEIHIIGLRPVAYSGQLLAGGRHRRSSSIVAVLPSFERTSPRFQGAKRTIACVCPDFIV